MDNNIINSNTATPLSNTNNTDTANSVAKDMPNSVSSDSPNTFSNINSSSSMPASSENVTSGGHIALISSLIINVLVISVLSFMIYYFGVPTMNDKLMISESEKQDELSKLNIMIKGLEDKAQKAEDRNIKTQMMYDNAIMNNKASSTVGAGIMGKDMMAGDMLSTTTATNTKPWVKSK